MIIYSLTLLLLSCNLIAYEYIYPIGSLDQTIYYARQIDQKTVQLYKKEAGDLSLKPEHYSFNQEILHNFSVRNFITLPGKKGYSFIDNGRLRVKYNGKSSPISVDFLYPFSDIHSACWIDESSGLISARYKNYFGIFYFCVDGRVEQIAWQYESNFLYPQIINDLIFCLRKTGREMQFVMIDISLESIKLKKWQELTDEEKVAIFFQTNEGEQSRQTSTDIICLKYICNATCLYMQDEKHSYYIAYPSVIDSGDQFIVCTYMRLCTIDKNWIEKKLFSFNVPTWLLCNPEKKLIEGITLFEPLIIDEHVYFVHADDISTMGIYRYHMESDSIELVYKEKNMIYFGCKTWQEKLLYGCFNMSSSA